MRRRINVPRRVRALVASLSLATLLTLVVGGLAFAVLQSQVGEVQGNVIRTASASLLVSRDGNNFEQAVEGFTFDNIIPGSAPAPATGHAIYVKNVGTAPLAVHMNSNVDIENLQGVDLSKVHIVVTPALGGAVQSFTLLELSEAKRQGTSLPLTKASRLAPGDVYAQSVQVAMDIDAVGASQATLRNIVFNFEAAAVQ